MANDPKQSLDTEALGILMRILQAGEPDSETEVLARYMAGRSLVDLAVASLGNGDVQVWLSRGLADERIDIQAVESGAVSFYVPDVAGEFVYVFLTPEDFNVVHPQELRRFHAYRALVDIARRLPALGIPHPDNDASIVHGPFCIYCGAGADDARWAAVWERWEHAHGA